MKPKIALFLIVICLISQSFLGYYRAPSIYPIFDSHEAALPRNFRTTRAKEIKSSLNFKGLNYLRASGSGQFSEASFAEMMNHLSLSPERLVVIDLREESHGFINGKPVSWTDGDHNYANLHRSKNEIESDEYHRLKVAGETKEIIINPVVETKKLKVHSVNTERAVVENRGSQYIRLPVTDLNRPSNEVVDQFIEYVKCLPEDHWVHFHCRAGKGRTTTFMALLDIMKNGQQVEFKDIIARQKLIGGSDLTSVQKQDSEKARAANERFEFVKSFYLYCRQVPDFKTSWSEWLDQQQTICSNP